MGFTFLEEQIEKLDINTKVINALKNNNILKIRDLCCLSKNNLKDFGIEDDEIKYITIKLQLNGLDLNKKIKRKLV